jgi:hypothetical protein
MATVWCFVVVRFAKQSRRVLTAEDARYILKNDYA